jgi:hypothetical protein
MLCPKCKIDHAHRSHRKGLERLAAFFGYYPYRCRECGYRFLQFRYASPLETGKHSETEREIRSTRMRVRWKRKKRALLLYGFCALIFAGFLYFITRPGALMGN